MSTVTSRPSIRLSADEVEDLTGYKQPRKQLEVLHARGFYRADLDRFGAVRLEREHYEAVCSGESGKARPMLRQIVRNVKANRNG